MTMVQPPVPAARTPDRARGVARYATDLVPADAVLVEVARSPHAHARVTGIDTRATLEIPGVLAVLTPTDFDGIALGHQIAD